MIFEHKFENEVFAIAFHPEKPQFVVGFATGLVSAYEYPNEAVEQIWTTKRHRKSCRCINYNYNGSRVYTVGSDLVVKAAASSSGRVLAKTRSALSSPPSASCVNDRFIVFGDEHACLVGLDLNTLSQVFRVENLHDDFISSVLPLPHMSDFHFVTCGAFNLVRLDANSQHKTARVQSVDQNDELLSCCSLSQNTLALGHSEGAVSIWTDSATDYTHVLTVSPDYPVECVIPAMDEVHVYCGSSDGKLRKVRVSPDKIRTVSTLVHSDCEEVSFMDLDYEFRLVSATSSSLKLWSLDDWDHGVADSRRSKKRGRRARNDHTAPQTSFDL